MTAESSKHEANAEIVPEPHARRNAAWIAAALLALVLAGAWLRFQDLAPRPLWLDEASFWESSHASFLDKLAWRHHYEHPPLAYMIEGWVFQWLGDRPEWVVRLPSFVFGLSCIPLAFLLGRVIAGPTTGLLAAALATVDPVMVEQSRQARMYSQFEALLLLTLTAAIAIARRRPRSRLPWIGLGALEAALEWTSQAGLAAWGGQILGILWLRRGAEPERPAERTRWGWTWGTAVVLWSPGLYRLVQRLIHPIMNPADAADAAHLALDMATTVAGVFGRPWGALLLPIAIFGLWLLVRRRPIAGRVLAAIAGANLAGLLVLRAIHPLLKSRYLVALFPSIWVGGAAFVTLGAPRSRTRPILFSLAFAGLLAGDLLTTRMDAYQVGEEVRALARAVRAGDAVVYLPRFNEMVGSYYGIPSWPVLGPHEDTPPPASLDGHRVWLVNANLPAERYIREARDLLAALARRRGADATTELDRLRRGYSGIVLVQVDGRLSAFRPSGDRLLPERGP